MKKNMTNADRIIRVLIAVTIVALYFGNVIPSSWAIVLLIISGIFIITSFVGFCPLYYPFRRRAVKRE